MSNMSYCRFQNTLSDFRECHNTLCGLVESTEDQLSDDELRAAKQLAREAWEFIITVVEASGMSLQELKDKEDRSMNQDVIEELVQIINDECEFEEDENEY